MTPRGLRNNNPGNIRHGDKWQGLAKEQTDESFCQFSSMTYGCRALLRLLNTYYTKHNIDTIRLICSRWAPTNENDTEAYISYVSNHVGIDASEHIDFKQNPKLFVEIAKAITIQENGKAAKDISDEVWDKAYKLAFNA